LFLLGERSIGIGPEPGARLATGGASSTRFFRCCDAPLGSVQLGLQLGQFPLGRLARHQQLGVGGRPLHGLLFSVDRFLALLEGGKFQACLPNGVGFRQLHTVPGPQLGVFAVLVGPVQLLSATFVLGLEHLFDHPVLVDVAQQTEIDGGLADGCYFFLFLFAAAHCHDLDQFLDGIGPAGHEHCLE